MELLELLYDSVNRPELLPVFFGRLLENLKGATAVLFLQDLREKHPLLDTLICWNTKRRPVAAGPKNVWLIRSTPVLSAGAALSGHSVCSEQNLIWSEYSGRHKGTEIPGARITFLHPGVSRNSERGVVDLLGPLIPHLRRALSLQQTIIDLRMEREMALEVLDRLPMGVILVDEKEQVILMNRSARQVVQKKDGLTMKEGGLCAEDQETCAVLRTLIRDAMNPGFARRYPQGEYVSVSRRSGERPWPVLVSALSTGKVPGTDRAVVAVFVKDPCRPAAISMEALVRHFRLTKAEARLALGIVQGKSLLEVTREFRISMATAKTQLRSVFAKTETARQSELIRLVLGGLTEIGPQSAEGTKDGA